jgi:hypothetical protein
MKCDLCDLELKMQTVRLEYLDYRFTAELPCCPKCGQVYISEILVNGKVAELEKAFEEK